MVHKHFKHRCIKLLIFFPKTHLKGGFFLLNNYEKNRVGG